MYSKQQCAFVWSAERLYLTTGKMYFWTFTFKETYHIWQYMPLWDVFVKALERIANEPNLMGMRVVQMHPGGHGLHFHCLINQWLDARQVWRLCRRLKMGCDAIHLKNKDWREGVKYLCRYMTRDCEKFPISIRRVGSMWGFPMYPIRDLRFIHPNTDALAYLTRYWARGSYGLDVIKKVYESPNCTGDYRTLIVALHFQLTRTCESFYWTEQKMLDSLDVEPFNHWVRPEDTIYEPGLMPRKLEEQPF
jgi:hypothetical protein